ncbi:beta-glucosidase [Sphingomonas jinjuensis]|uniref:Beta-glucosidase n=1 Tax=Sphingomonas jinjuensis TaxID=535907 RepID=A0A840FCD5_9SPHN|nr:GH1 family beta-glucosidase [Sphingomonas jinjuensis]MBB4153217.1 beta-glucosidase [Sphingomonas jinjuensis]
MDRRDFIRTGAVLGSGLALGSGAASAQQSVTAPRAPSPVGPRAFPTGFRWGCATAAYQIEGGAREDGRGASIWDVFSRTPGKVANGDTGDVACDSYHRYAEDIALLKALGVGHYRFSTSWSRIFPEGRGTLNRKGLDYYNRVVDGLLAAGITPHVTLFHWDLPAALPGGWQSRDTAKAFADYAGFMASQLSDRVDHFMTTNEFFCFTDLGYKVGSKAPGLKLPDAAVNQIRHHGILAHGLGVQAIRARAKRPVQVGLADNPSIYCPVIETPEHIAAARKATRVENAPFLTAVLEGRYLDSYLKKAGAAAPKVEAGDMAAIGSPVDFVGLNVYAPGWARAADDEHGYAIIPHNQASPHMASPWLYVGPETAYWAVRHTTDQWKPKAIYITENGCSSDDAMIDGRVDDADRVMYLRNYIGHLQRAAAEGLPIAGYFLWSLMDNFEWEDGYGKRFGLHWVDFATQARTPKLSAQWYRELIRRNALV